VGEKYSSSFPESDTFYPFSIFLSYEAAHSISAVNFAGPRVWWSPAVPCFRGSLGHRLWTARAPHFSFWKDSSSCTFIEVFEGCAGLLPSFGQRSARLSAPNGSRSVAAGQRAGELVTRRLALEASALDQSVVAIFAAKALVRDLEGFEAEDRVGVGQSRAEAVLQALVEARKALESAFGYRWKSGRLPPRISGANGRPRSDSRQSSIRPKDVRLDTPSRVHESWRQ
jgi:hypothetical protein